MDAVVCSLDGAQYIRERGIGPGEATQDQATELGQSVARRLVENGAMNILDEVNRSRA